MVECATFSDIFEVCDSQIGRIKDPFFFLLLFEIDFDYFLFSICPAWNAGKIFVVFFKRKESYFFLDLKQKIGRINDRFLFFLSFFFRSNFGLKKKCLLFYQLEYSNFWITKIHTSFLCGHILNLLWIFIFYRNFCILG